MEGLAHIILIEIHYRFAIGALVARVDERIHRERVVVGRGDFFFDERAQDSGFSGGEQDRLSLRHKSILPLREPLLRVEQLDSVSAGSKRLA